MSDVYDVIVIGAGIAGLSAAVYTSRQGLRTLVISKDIGGQLSLTDEIQNYPGFLSIGGLELVRKVEQQARTFGAELVFDEVVKLDKDSDGLFVISTASGDEYKSIAVILAFGKTPRDLGVPGEQELKGKGVSYCTICDAALYKGQDVALVSWGEPAYEAAEILMGVVNRFYWVFPGSKPVPDDEFMGMVINSGKAVLLPNHEVLEIRGKGRVESVVVRDRVSKEVKEIPVKAVFIEIGYVAKTDFVKHLVKLNEKGEIIIDEYGRTSTEGLFAAGDVCVTPYKQAIIAAAQGVIAALTAYSYVMSKKGKEARVTADWRKINIPGREEGKRKGLKISI
ncbi:NAD(P)/FAD-dependent oxidoreductase [Vulcanisaeta thermophila]|uniref:NAD(P)/FAD-dependent oxidoreductase n=1 Tax=Vulcanisaeta thermophila TaxID=867917 RepID=UPI000852A84F|nr:FAD-dependent oxidoreductase [Vulcanisaeta thermophila]